MVTDSQIEMIQLEKVLKTKLSDRVKNILLHYEWIKDHPSI